MDGCRIRPRERAWSPMSRGSDGRVVDLHALGLPAVLAAHLLSAVRTLQSSDLAGAACGARARGCHSEPLARENGVAGAGCCGAAGGLLGFCGLHLPAGAV